MPLAEQLSLIFSDESQEERELRKSLGLYRDQAEILLDLDVDMSDPVACPSTQPPIAVPAPKGTIPNSEPITPSASLISPPTTVQIESTGRETSGHTSIYAQNAAKEPSPDISHTVAIEPSRTPASEVVSTSTQKMSAYRTLPPAEEEDEDIPVIDMNSDSDFE
jgi:hypothetical protein